KRNQKRKGKRKRKKKKKKSGQKQDEWATEPGGLEAAGKIQPPATVATAVGRGATANGKPTSRRWSGGRGGGLTWWRGGAGRRENCLAGKMEPEEDLAISGDPDLRLRRSWSCWKAGDTRILLGPVRDDLAGVWVVIGARRSRTFLALFRPFRPFSGISPFT